VIVLLESIPANRKAAMSVQDLPKVPTEIKDELTSFSQDKLKATQTQEKVVLPTKEDVAREKTHQGLIQGVESFDQAQLKHADTQEKNPLPTKENIEAEKGHNQIVSGIQNFDASQLKHATTAEKNVLPTADMIAQEKQAGQ